jgi:hypothetical protein
VILNFERIRKKSGVPDRRARERPPIESGCLLVIRDDGHDRCAPIAHFGPPTVRIDVRFWRGGRFEIAVPGSFSRSTEQVGYTWKYLMRSMAWQLTLK